VTAAASHFNIMFHENMGGQEIRDIVEAVGKVAAAYGKG
jgi:hypothetical protein